MVEKENIEDDLNLDEEFVDNKSIEKSGDKEDKENVEHTENTEELEENQEVQTPSEEKKPEENNKVGKEEEQKADITENSEAVINEKKEDPPVETAEESPKDEVIEKDIESVQEEKTEDLEEISLSEQPDKEFPPTRPTRPTRPGRPPRPASTTPQTSRSVTPNGNNNHLVAQLKDAFPSIQTKILTAIVIAAQNNIESCYDACLFYMNPNEFKPTFHPENFVSKSRDTLTEQERQLKRDEELARNLDRKYNSRPTQSRTLSERGSKLNSGRRTRESIPREDDSDEDDEFGGVQRFIDSELPIMKENVSKTLRETSSRVGSWFKSFGDNSNDLQRNKEEIRRNNDSSNRAYDYDEWGNPIFRQEKSYKIVERSPGFENKVLPQRPSEKTPSKQRSNSKPFINTPGNGANDKIPNANQQRSVSGSGNKRLVFVEPVENEVKPRSSVDDDLNLSD
ncbi:hypothetical protein FOG50_03984 [Hanseniaspora uvarum]|nr:hypothetical protein FOG50_03984 [Hanseniaspora uvarum]